MWFLCCAHRHRRGQCYDGISACCAGVWFRVEEGRGINVTVLGVLTFLQFYISVHQLEQ